MSVTNHARATIATGDALDVRSFSVEQRISELFSVDAIVVSRNLDIDLDAVIGQDAAFQVEARGEPLALGGICREMEQLRVDDRGLATYRLTIVPRAWLLTQRKNYRIFQYESELEIVTQLLGEWGIEHEVRTVRSHGGRKFRVQYAESDFAFLSRMLEDAGISYFFEPSSEGSKMVLDDEPQSRELGHPLLRYHDEPSQALEGWVTHLAVRARLRPGKVRMGDLDFRRASTNQPSATASGGLPQEQRLEQFDYEPGAFLYTTAAGGKTPAADDRGAARTDDAAGAIKAQNRLLARRTGARTVTFDSNVIQLAPGAIVSVFGHPHREVAPDKTLLVLATVLSGDHDGEFRTEVEAVSTAIPHRPEQVTPKPEVRGVESATVVGPVGAEIHTDEYVRVRVHFHWDRESGRNEASSCWLPTNQPWAGAGYGAINVPRIGQEVWVGFLGGDPDRPVVLGRVYTESNPVPDPLPKYKHVSGLFSESTPRLIMGSSVGAPAGPGTSIYGGTPMSSQQIASTVTQAGPFQAVSPTGTTHAWKGSGLKLDDWSGKEIAYLQANKDLHVVVYNDWHSVVGNHRATKIGTDEITYVRENQEIVIGKEQRTTVNKDWISRVEREKIDKVGQKLVQEAKESISLESDVGNLVLHAKKAIRMESDTTIELRTCKSVVKLTKSEIVVEAGDNKVFINPKSG